MLLHAVAIFVSLKSFWYRSSLNSARFADFVSTVTLFFTPSNWAAQLGSYITTRPLKIFSNAHFLRSLRKAESGKPGGERGKCPYDSLALVQISGWPHNPARDPCDSHIPFGQRAWSPRDPCDSHIPFGQRARSLDPRLFPTVHHRR
jgi:hypothetical protein